MKRINRPLAWLPLIISVSLAAGIVVGVFFNSRFYLSPGQKKLADILSLISNDYVDPVDVDSLIELTLPDLLANLDPHSNYIPAEDLKAINDELEGSFSGIGISFTMFTDTITVNEVIPGGPSEKAGLFPGDRIVTINDSVVAGMGIPNTEIVKRLRGDKGSVVKLGVRRSTSKKLLNFEVTRGDIPVNSVDAAYMIDSITGYIKVNKFGRTTYDEFLSSLARLTGKGATQFVVDLRGNGGGYLEMAIMMANEFLPVSAPIVETRGRHYSENTAIASDGNGSFQNAGLVVLLDEYSASASEIFAGAMQDNDRALIVGRRSFGKGLVQRQVTLPDSSALRLTVQRYYTPSGRCIQKPYVKGDLDDYALDIKKRFDSGELMHPDSLRKVMPDSLRFTTLKKHRTVYGGGGVMPDVAVPLDTAWFTPYYRDIMAKGLIVRYTIGYIDAHRSELLKKYPDEKSFAEHFTVTDEMLNSLTESATANGVEMRPEEYEKSRAYITMVVKALLARDLYDSGSYYRITNLESPTFNEGLRIINSPKEYSRLLNGE